MRKATTSGKGMPMGPVRRVLYVGPFRFPNGDAAAQRVLGIGRAIRSTGIEVEFCGWTKKRSTDDCVTTETETFEGFRFRNVPEFRFGAEGPIARTLHHLAEGKLTLRWLEENVRRGDLVILYNWYGPYVSKTIQFCNASKVPVIVDAVEWYEPYQCAGGRFGLVRWEVENCLRRVFRRADGIIAISSYLTRHFSASTRTVRIPPLIDALDPKWTQTQGVRPHLPIRLCYSGFPGRKDVLYTLFEALERLDTAGNFAMDVVGPDRTDFNRLFRSPDMPRIENIRCLGKLSHAEAIRAVGSADYSVLIRPNRRYANAGFSTKFVESLAVGTPPFCNVTSDIGEFSTDGKDSIHISDDSIQAVIEGLKRLELIDRNRLGEMRSAARQRAKSEFDWREYAGRISTFINEVAHESM